jgi:hypothetical protein
MSTLLARQQRQLARRARPRPQVLFCASCRRGLVGRRALGHIARPGEQAAPLAGYYADLAAHPLAPSHPAAAAVRFRPLPPSSPPSSPAKDEALAKARIVFGSRLAGPAAVESGASPKMVAGVLVPPRPAEPDNCCMSGCVNCVWDVYREDLEEWVAAAGEASRRLALQDAASGAEGLVGGKSGGKSAAAAARAKAKENANASSDLADAGRGADDLMQALPVGIRQFIKTEKMLKMKHAAEGPRV